MPQGQNYRFLHHWKNSTGDVEEPVSFVSGLNCYSGGLQKQLDFPNLSFNLKNMVKLKENGGYFPPFLSFRKGRNSHRTVANTSWRNSAHRLFVFTPDYFFPSPPPPSLLFANQSHSGQSLQQTEQHSILALSQHQMNTEELQCPQQNKGEAPFPKHLLLLCCGSREAKLSALHLAKVLTGPSVAQEATILKQSIGPCWVSLQAETFCTTRCSGFLYRSSKPRGQIGCRRRGRDMLPQQLYWIIFIILRNTQEHFPACDHLRFRISLEMAEANSFLSWHSPLDP